MPFNLSFFRKKWAKVLQRKKNVVPLHTQSGVTRIAKDILGYGVMVTLQILVLSFLVRVRVSQQRKRQLEIVSSCLFCFSTYGFYIIYILYYLLVSALYVHVHPHSYYAAYDEADKSACR